MPQIEAVLAVVSILANYGRHLAQTLEQRAVRRGFATIARFFGSVVFDNIMAHIYRGMMRAIALERMLKQRAKYGRDLKVLAPRAWREPKVKDPETGDAEGSAVPDELTPEQIAAAQAAADTKAGERLARRIARDEPLTMENLPRTAAINAQVLRTPIGCTVTAICGDFGISAALCDGMFWNSLCDAIDGYRGSLGNYLIGIHRRSRKFDKEEWKHPGLELPEETREGVRRVLGFFIGEALPDDPFEDDAGPRVGVAAVATGPP